MEAYVQSISDVLMVGVKITDLSRRDQVELMRKLMKLTGYSDALYTPSTLKLGMHLDKAWAVTGAYIDAEPSKHYSPDPLILAAELDHKGLDIFKTARDPLAVRNVLIAALKKLGDR